VKELEERLLKETRLGERLNSELSILKVWLHCHIRMCMYVCLTFWKCFSIDMQLLLLILYRVSHKNEPCVVLLNCS